MENREKYLINSFEILNKEYEEIIKENNLRYQIKKNLSIEEIKRKISRLIIKIKYKISNLQEKRNLGNDVEFEEYKGNKKIVIYTCITGDYDNLLEPYYMDPKCEYIIFSDQNIKSDIYKTFKIPKKIENMNNILINRYIKLHPHEIFEKEYDYSIYIDGNIQQISNLSAFINNINEEIGIAMHKHSVRNCIYEEAKALKIQKKGNKKFINEQIKKYENEKFPPNYGMAEANVIVTDLNNNKSKKIFEDWWEEFINSKSMRDQVSLPYILWRNNISMDLLTTLGSNVYNNPKLRKKRHL